MKKHLTPFLFFIDNKQNMSLSDFMPYLVNYKYHVTYLCFVEEKLGKFTVVSQIFNVCRRKNTLELTDNT